MSTTLDECGQIQLNQFAGGCQRCGTHTTETKTVRHQITGPNGYVQLCQPCLLHLALVTTHGVAFERFGGKR